MQAGFAFSKLADRLASLTPVMADDLHTLYRPRVDGNLIALGPAIVALVPHRFFHDLSARSPVMSRALLLMLLTTHAIQRNWTVNLGSRDALTRVAHLLCEITT